jgi:hypothetical protein
MEANQYRGFATPLVFLYYISVETAQLRWEAYDPSPTSGGGSVLPLFLYIVQPNEVGTLVSIWG